MGKNNAGRGVTVGVDGTATAQRAVGWATAEAGARAVPLTIVHAAPYAGHTEGRRRAETILAHACSTAHRCDGGVAVHTETLDGQPVAALIQASDDADLLVLGMAADRPGEVTLRSVAVAVSARARCPVTVVRGHHRAPTSGRPALLGVEDVRADAPAVTAAFADAERHGTPLVILHARPAHAPGSDADVAAELEARLAPWRRAHPGVPTEVRIEHGRPEDALLHAAAQARLVTVSTHRHGVARLVLGSCSRALTRHSPCPVGIVGHGGTDTVLPAAGIVPVSAIDPHDMSQLW